MAATTSGYSLQRVSSGHRDNHITVTIRWNSADFLVRLDRSYNGLGMEDILIFKYNSTIEFGSDDDADDICEEIVNKIVEVGHEKFDQLARLHGSNRGIYSHAPEREFSFYLRTIDDVLQLIPAPGPTTYGLKSASPQPPEWIRHSEVVERQLHEGFELLGIRY